MMTTKKRVFLDASTIIAGVLSGTGAARAILMLGEAEAIQLLVSKKVLREVEGVMKAKAPDLMGTLALLLDRSNVETVPAADKVTIDRCFERTGYRPDARVLAVAVVANVDYFVTHDHEHFLGNPLVEGEMEFLLGSPGKFLIWYRDTIVASPAENTSATTAKNEDTDSV